MTELATIFKALADETRAFLKGGVPDAVSQTNAQLMEIMMAQDFQDLTGQVIKKIVALAQEMEASILATLYLKELGVKRIVAKALTLDHAKVLRRLGATEVVFPERDMAYRLAERLATPNVFERFAVSEGFSAVELSAPAPLVGLTLREAELRSRYGVTVVAIRKHGERVIIVPDGWERVEPGDVLVVIGPDEQVRAFEHL